MVLNSSHSIRYTVDRVYVLHSRTVVVGLDQATSQLQIIMQSANIHMYLLSTKYSFTTDVTLFLCESEKVDVFQEMGSSDQQQALEYVGSRGWEGS